jgi:hypothetical protein
MSSLINDQDLQSNIIDFKRRHHNLGLGNFLERLGEVGQGYYKGFLCHHIHHIVTKRGEQFASSPADWSKFSCIKQMYDIIYNEYIATGVANEVYMDREGNTCEQLAHSLARQSRSTLLT